MVATTGVNDKNKEKNNMEIKLNNVGMFLLTVILGGSVKVLWTINKGLYKKVDKLEKEVEAYKNDELGEDLKAELDGLLD